MEKENSINARDAKKQAEKIKRGLQKVDLEMAEEVSSTNNKGLPGKGFPINQSK